MMNLRNNFQRLRQVFGTDMRRKTEPAIPGSHNKKNTSDYITEWGMAKNTEGSNNVDNGNGFINNTETKGNHPEQFY